MKIRGFWARQKKNKKKTIKKKINQNASSPPFYEYLSQGVTAKESVLQVIASAKAVFQSEEASEQLISQLKGASQVTADAVDSLV
jgi:hypothetical protein